MKSVFVVPALAAITLIASCQPGQTKAADPSNVKDSVSTVLDSIPESLYIDVHRFGPGKVNYEAVVGAHAKDLAVQAKYGVHFLKFWVDEAAGTVYCLSSARDTQSIHDTHALAHGLLPSEIFRVIGGTESALNAGKNFFLDVHELGAGKVTAKDVAAAHQKDLETEQKYGVNFINYWVDEKAGRVVCLSQASDSAAVIKTHSEAHGLIPAYIVKVKQGE